MERTAAGIGFRVNAHKTEYMCYNQTGEISTLDGTPLKLVDKGSSVSSTEKDIYTRLTKAWTATDRLSIIWKSFLTDKMKLPTLSVSSTHQKMMNKKKRFYIGIFSVDETLLPKSVNLSTSLRGVPSSVEMSPAGTGLNVHIANGPLQKNT